MELIFEEKDTNGLFKITRDSSYLRGEGILQNESTINTIVCNTQVAQNVIIDQVTYLFPEKSILLLSSNQHFIFEKPRQLIAWQFNREFYCIAEHDSEVECIGFLFYGLIQPLVLPLTDEELENVLSIELLAIKDMAMKDRMQGEMLRTLLKRLIISMTRVAKKMQGYGLFENDDKLNLVRQFNLLLETNFRVQHEVRFYAGLLNRSPKTLSNLFTLFGYPPPSKLIQQRIILEAKRYLYYTRMSAKEIAFALGFTSPSHFSRFFKSQTGRSISAFRNKK